MYVLLFCKEKPLFIYLFLKKFTDSISEIFDIIAVTFKNYDLLGVTRQTKKIYHFLKAVREEFAARVLVIHSSRESN